MNTKEIMSMTDEELRVKAAHLCGWTELEHVGTNPAGYAAYFGTNPGGEGEWLPDYPNDIAAAWELVEHNPDWRWSVYELDGGGWAATPMKVIGTRGEYSLWDHVSEATEETAPRAITIAFIMAMENK